MSLLTTKILIRLGGHPGLFDSSMSVNHFVGFVVLGLIPYFFGYKMEFFSFQNSPKDLDPSYKMALDLWDSSGRVKLIL